MRHDLRVRLGDEAMPFRLQLALQLEVVLDDAVVHDDNAAVAVGVRMRIFLGRTPVRRPPRVPDAKLAVDRIPREYVLESGQLARAAPDFHPAVDDDGHAGRVVAPVLEPAQ